MSYHPDDTICAIATATGGAARGIVRVSGPGAIAVAAKLFQADDDQSLDSLWQPTALAGTLHMPLIDGVKHTLPCDLFLWPTDRSYTRQPVAELHTLGSPPLIEALVAAACRAGARLAEPGEFTLRAFLAGRIDLTQAEAVLGVIDARGDDDLASAIAQLAGGLARPLQHLREELLQLLAELEAGLDFVDEDIEFVSSDEVLARLASAGKLLADVDQQMASRSTAGQAARVALVGPPNVGKSSLFNALVARRGIPQNTGRHRSSPALVSPQHGTTRDYLTAAIDLGGMQCELVDTAGVDKVLADHAISPAEHRPNELSMIDAAAQALAVQRRAEAVIRLCCVDASAGAMPADVRGSQCDVVVLTKTDLTQPPVQFPDDWPRQVPLVATSSRTGAGLGELCVTIRQLLMTEAVAQHGQVVGATADRCRESVRLAAAALERAMDIVTSESGDELVATELRSALSELGKVVGAVYTDDLLDRIFSSFCIGK